VHFGWGKGVPHLEGVGHLMKNTNALNYAAQSIIEFLQDMSFAMEIYYAFCMPDLIHLFSPKLSYFASKFFCGE